MTTLYKSVYLPLLGWGILTFSCVSAGAQVKIMPLGDSITKGAVAPGPSLSGYRARLFDDLNAAHIKYQFVGCADINSNAAMFAAGQQFHNGYGSWRIDSLLANLDGVSQPDGDNNMGGFWLSGAAGNGRAPVFPDIVLLLAGTNDLGSGATEAVLEKRMGDLLRWFQTKRPRAQIFVGTVPPRGPEKPDYEKYNVACAAFNRWLTARVGGMGTDFHVVDIYKLFTDASGHVKAAGAPDGVFLQDGIHPTHNGYVAMGDLWFQSIKPCLGQNP